MGGGWGLVAEQGQDKDNISQIELVYHKGFKAMQNTKKVLVLLETSKQWLRKQNNSLAIKVSFVLSVQIPLLKTKLTCCEA